jgi:hypothetical protein
MRGFTETVDLPVPAAPVSEAALPDEAATTDPVDFDVGEIVDEPEPPPPPEPRPLAHLTRAAETPGSASAAPRVSAGGATVSPIGRLARPDEVWPLPRSVGPGRRPTLKAAPPPPAPEPPPPEPASLPEAPEPALQAPPESSPFPRTASATGLRRTGSPAMARGSREPAITALAPSAAPAVERSGRQGFARNRRLHRRVKLAADIDIDGVSCGLVDLSIGGFAASGAPPVAPNTVVPINLRLTIDGIDVGTQLGARIIYATEARAGGRFVELSPSQSAFLRYVVTWRGESVGPVGATTLLDAITGGIDRAAAEPAPAIDEPTDPAPRERWWLGLRGRKVKPPR